MDVYLILKALHIIFVVTWFAGLFYLPRLFIYFIEAQDRPENERLVLQKQLRIMQKKLWYGITWPSCLLAISFGTGLISHWLPLAENPWLVVKLGFVALLFLYHLSLGKINRQLQKGILSWTSTQLRMWNEIPTVFLIGTVFLVVTKGIIPMSYGLLGLAALIMALMSAIKIYKKFRKSVR